MNRFQYHQRFFQRRTSLQAGTVRPPVAARDGEDAFAEFRLKLIGDSRGLPEVPPC